MWLCILLSCALNGRCVAFAWYLTACLFFCSCVVQSHSFSVTPLHHSLMCVLSCSALLHLPSFSCIFSGGCPYLGPFVFSAVPVPPPPGVNIEEHIQIRQEEKRQRINRRHRLEEGRGTDQSWTEGAVWGSFCFRMSKLLEE